MKEIYLDSGLNISRFGQTAIGTLINEKGICLENGVFAQWKFEKTEIRQSVIFCEETVAFCGSVEAFEGENLLSLKEIFSGDNYELVKNSVVALTECISKAISENFVLPEVGFGGVYFVYDNENIVKKIIFLPAEVFSRCVSNYGEKDFTEFSGSSLRSGLKNEENCQKAAAFLRASAVYKLLAGKNAYTETDKNKRNLDMIDGKFLLLELAFFNCPKNLSESVNLALNLAPKYQNVSKSKKALDKQTLKDELAVEKAVNNFPMDEFLSALKNLDEKNENNAVKNATSDEKLNFYKIQGTFLNRQKRIVGISRFLRRNGNRLMVLGAAILIGIYFVTSFIKGNENLYTSTGATAEETVEMLYKGINDADVTIVQEVAKGKKIKDLETMVVGLRVKYRSHAAMTELGGNCTPEQWLSKKGETNFWMYGVTNLQIEGNDIKFKEKYPTRKIHSQPLTSENGGGTKNEEKVVKATYYLVHSDSDYRINIIKSTENVTVKWTGKKWVVTEISGNALTKTIETKKLKSDFKESLEKNSGDLNQAAAELKSKYEWLPEYF